MHFPSSTNCKCAASCDTNLCLKYSWGEVPVCQTLRNINLDGHYSNQNRSPWPHLFFMNFHPHPPLQTFAETTCGCEWISWKVYACLPACPCVFVCVCVRVCVCDSHDISLSPVYARCRLLRPCLRSAPPCQHKSKPGHKQEYVLTRVIITVTPALAPYAAWDAPPPPRLHHFPVTEAWEVEPAISETWPYKTSALQAPS